MSRQNFLISRTFKFIVMGLVAGALLLGAASAYAGPFRAARSVLMGSKAAQMVTENSGEDAAAKTDENLKRLSRSSKPSDTVRR